MPGPCPGARVQVRPGRAGCAGSAISTGHYMTLTQQDIEFIKENMATWLEVQSLGKLPAVYEIELRERMV